MKQPQPNVYVDKDTGFWLFDSLLERWNAEPKMFPYDQPRAVIPQNIVPGHIRQSNDPESIYYFYFYICLYMRGGIESIQAFRAMIKLRQDMPELFDPYHAQHLTPEELQPIVAEYVGWDSENVAKYWIDNSQRLMRHWDGKASNIFKGMNDWDEAQRRIWNAGHSLKKTTFGKDATTGQYLGFIGFRPKMVSMLVYFIDWEGLLPKRFPYPTPADFHNFRLALAHRVIVLDPEPKNLRNHELISAPWRDLTLRYLKERKADPVELADAVWLFSLEMCGNSPLTDWREPSDTAEENGEKVVGLNDEVFTIDDLPSLLSKRYRQRLRRTCLACPILDTCELAVPAGPYYQRRKDRKEAFGGQLYLLPRFPIERHVEPMQLDYLPTKVTVPEKPNGVIFQELPEQVVPERPTKLPL